jgi:hypothetical protein
MAKNKKKVWNDGLVQAKTATNPKGGGRVPGRDYSYLNTYPGEQAEYRMSWSRMKAQAKYRGETWDITWEEYQQLWDRKWHLRGTSKLSHVLTKRDQEGIWTVANVEIIPRLDQWRRQHKVRGQKRNAKE